MLTEKEIDAIGAERSPYTDFQFARAIEAAATAPLLARIAELSNELRDQKILTSKARKEAFRSRTKGKERIAELEAGLEARLQGSERMSETIATLERKLAQQRDAEPDAWLYHMPLGGRVLENTRLDHFHPDGKGDYVKGVPLYLNPAPPKPVPLTDAQIEAIIGDNSLDSIHAVIRAVESAHGTTGETK